MKELLHLSHLFPLQAESSPFVERLLKKGYEVIYLTEPVDEYCIQALPEFDGKRFQNVAKEGVKFDESEKAKEKRETQEKEFEPLTTWLKDKALKDKVNIIFFYLNSWYFLQLLFVWSICLVVSPTDWEGCAVPEAHKLTLCFGSQSVRLVWKHGEDHEGPGLSDWKRYFHKVSTGDFVLSGANVHDHVCNCVSRAYLTFPLSPSSYYASQKKTLEINPKHPLIKQMLNKVNVSLIADTTFVIF